MSNRSRRQFLEDSMFATAAVAAAATTGPAWAKEDKKRTSANDKLSVAVIGVRGQGGEHLLGYTGLNSAEVTYICDVDEKVGQNRVKEVAERQGRAPKYVRDLRQMLDDKSVDCVSIATPNHWHALASIWAMQAGKDVYVEKPVSHNVTEGRRIVEAALKYNKICQTGTQSRSMSGMRQAIEYLHSGKLGEVSLARGLCYKRRKSIGPAGTYEVPPSVDYDLWCGPAPDRPVTRPQFHYDWHWQWAYGNGDLGNQGIHQMDIARWGLGLDRLADAVISYGGRFGYKDAGETANTQVSILDYGPKTLVFEVRGLETKDYKGASVGVIFQGSEGYVVIPSYSSAVAFDQDGKVVTKFSGSGNHFDNFLRAVRSRDKKDLHADILEGHLSSALCHLCNISYRLGGEVSAPEALERLKALKTNENVQDTFERTREHLADNQVSLDETRIQLGPWLAFNPEKETFVENSQADAMLTREYRQGFVVPAAGEV